MFLTLILDFFQLNMFLFLGFFFLDGAGTTLKSMLGRIIFVFFTNKEKISSPKEGKILNH